MKDRLLPFAVLVVLASVVAGGFMIFSAPGVAIVSASVNERPGTSPIAGGINGQAPRAKAATISSTRPPVPLVLSRHHTPFVENVPTPGKATGNTIAEIQETNGTSAAEAKAMIEADGYRSVKALVKAPDGVWRGSALRGVTEVAISVDSGGRVSTQ